MRRSILEVLAVCGLVMLLTTLGALQLNWHQIPINPADLNDTEQPLWAILWANVIRII